MHDLVRDPALVAQRDDGGTLGLEQLTPYTLIRERALLDRAVVVIVEAGTEAALPELIEAPHALGRVGAHGALVDELVEARDRGVRGIDARLRLLLHVQPVVLQAEESDDER